MAKYKVAEFGFAVYKDGEKVDVSFKKAKKVPGETEITNLLTFRKRQAYA